MYKPDLIIYHANCADGFGAAWACWMRWGGECEYLAANYGQEPPAVDGKHILIVDFSYKRDVLKVMGEKARSIIILDHHKTSEADLSEWAIDDVTGEFWAGDAPEKLIHYNDDYIGQPIAALFDGSKSGARLAWEFCHDIEPPLLVMMIEDRDLWRFTIPETKAFSAWLRCEPMTFERWELLSQELNDGSDAALIFSEAAAMQRLFDAKVNEIADMAWRGDFGGHEPMIVNCLPMFASEVGHALLGRHPDIPFSAMFYVTERGRVWSLRSRDDRVDVSQIAASLGGGGHRNAAGCFVPSMETNDG